MNQAVGHVCNNGQKLQSCSAHLLVFSVNTEAWEMQCALELELICARTNAMKEKDTWAEFSHGWCESRDVKA